MFFLGGEGPRGGVAIATPLRGTRKGGRIGSDSLPFRGFLTEPAKGERIRADSTGCKKMANVAPERGPFLEGNLGGTKRHATVRDDLFRRESPPKVVHERGATFAHVFGSGKREEIAPLSLLSLLSLSSLSSVSSLSSLRSN